MTLYLIMNVVTRLSETTAFSLADLVENFRDRFGFYHNDIVPTADEYLLPCSRTFEFVKKNGETRKLRTNPLFGFDQSTGFAETLNTFKKGEPDTLKDKGYMRVIDFDILEREIHLEETIQDRILSETQIAAIAYQRAYRIINLQTLQSVDGAPVEFRTA